MNRFQHTLRHELYLHSRTILTITFAVAGSVMVLQMVRWVVQPLPFNLWSGFPLVSIVTGLIVTSGMFNELRSPGSRIELLLRPVSALEKIGAKLLVSTLFFFLAITAAYLVVSLVSLILYFSIGGREELIAFFAGGRWLGTVGSAFLDFLPLHAIFFFGAVYFRRNPAGRTLMSLVGSIAGYLLLFFLFVRIAFAPYLTGRYSAVGAPRAMGLQLDSENIFLFADRFWVQLVPGFVQNGETVGLAVRTLLPLVFWALAVLRFRETEG